MLNKTRKIGQYASFNKGALLALFVTSYTPLFFIIILKQVFSNYEFLNFADFSLKSILCFIQKFGLTCVFIPLILFGFVGLRTLLGNLSNKANYNGYRAQITAVKNQNDQFSNYMVSYIIPIAFLSSDEIIDSVLILIILYVIYRLYVKSSMILVNPMLSFLGYYLYECEYIIDKDKEVGILLIDDKTLEEGDSVFLYPIGYKSYYSKK